MNSASAIVNFTHGSRLRMQTGERLRPCRERFSRHSTSTRGQITQLSRIEHPAGIRSATVVVPPLILANRREILREVMRRRVGGLQLRVTFSRAVYTTGIGVGVAVLGRHRRLPAVRALTLIDFALTLLRHRHHLRLSGSMGGLLIV